MFNVYGHNTCGNDSICLAGLWKTAGLKVAPARLVGHCVTQVFYDGAWHLFDGDMHSLYLLRDNETIAGEQDLVRDHDLIKRTHTQGILRPQGRAGDEWESSIYVFEGEVTGDRNADRDSAMNMTLRPGEALVWRWGHTEPVKYFGSPEHKFVERICNGLWEYRPDFTQRDVAEGRRFGRGNRVGRRRLAGRGGQDRRSRVDDPLPLCDCRRKARDRGDRRQVRDFVGWQDLGKRRQRSRRVFPAGGNGSLRLSTALPARRRGAAAEPGDRERPADGAAFAARDGDRREPVHLLRRIAPASARVRITHEWVERSASAPPAPPAAPISPRDRGEAEGTDVVFEWQPAVDPDGDKIADYHFELSSRADMKWPLSMSFAKLISRTSDAGSARFTLKAPGELNPDREYYWHVRAKDAQGSLGTVEQDVELHAARTGAAAGCRSAIRPREESGHSSLAAESAGPQAGRLSRLCQRRERLFGQRRAVQVAAGIYDFQHEGIDQSADAVPGELSGGNARPPNWPWSGPASQLAGANKAFYRVVAVDEQGNRSGPSDYAAAPRPVIYSQPVDAGQVGRGISLRRSCHPLARRSADAGRRRARGDELLGRRAAAIPSRTRTEMADHRRSDRPIVGQAGSRRASRR